MKKRYIDLMEKALSAYSESDIVRYFDDVRQNGLTEHGFPRLTANIGILIAQGRRRELLPLFEAMMELCCASVPRVQAANDFSVRELVSCLLEIERAACLPANVTARWRGYLASIEPYSCYTRLAKSPSDYYRNWVLFSSASEIFRQNAGLCDSRELLDLQLLQQRQWLDENGMYCDNRHADGHQPMMYDLASRGLLSLILDQGYCGREREAIDAALKKAALLTLDMQSPCGEIAFGGRSNQFVLCEPWLAAVCEYERKRYAREGDDALAARFGAALERALAVTERWLSEKPIRHIKNRFPTDSRYGCEGYGYFDKYMITVASNLYVAYLICDDSIPCVPTPDRACVAVSTSAHFHKLFLKAGGYGLEFDTAADPEYDANGLGRVHREGAPTTICLSCPCPSGKGYRVDLDEPKALSLCSVIREDGILKFAAESGTEYDVLEYEAEGDRATASLLCRFEGGRTVRERYLVDGEGLTVTLESDGEIGFALPALCFDGEKESEIAWDAHSLTVSYEGWLCRYTTDGEITDTERLFANRNGHYRAFLAKGIDSLSVRISILRM